MQSEGTRTASSSIHDLSQEILKKDDLRVQTQYDCIQRYKNDHQLSNSTKIFVGGLPADLTVDEFRDYFQKFGSMEDVVVMSDKETSRPRGFGFVTFESPETAEKVLNNRFYELKNKRVEVKKAVSKERMSRNFGNYYDTYNAFYNGTTFPFATSSSYGNFGGGYNNYNYGMNGCGYGYGSSYGCEGLSYIYYPYQSYTSTYYANNYQNLSYYADTYSYQSPCFYGNTPYSSKHTNRYKNKTLNVVKDGGGDSNVTIKNPSLVHKKFEDLHLGSDGEKNGDGNGTEISEGLRLDCNGGGGGESGCGGGDGTEISEGLRLDCGGGGDSGCGGGDGTEISEGLRLDCGGGGDSGCGGGDGTEISEGLRLDCNGGGGDDSGCGGGCAVVIDQDLSL